jgi:hypothetical protein
MLTRSLALMAGGAALAVVLTATSSHAGMPMTRVNNLTFSHAVALPGVTLAAGTYAFESGPASTHANLVRVRTVNQRQQLFLGFTIPISRPPGAPGRLLVFGEAQAGEPTPIVAWYPVGSDRGHEFLYGR